MLKCGNENKNKHVKWTINKSLVDRWKASLFMIMKQEKGKGNKTVLKLCGITDSMLNDTVSLRNVNLVSLSCSDLKHALSDKLFKRLRCCIYAQ